MESDNSTTDGIFSYVNGHSPCSYRGPMTEHITSQQCFNNTGRRKSKVRLNDQLIPKPTDINVMEKTIKAATPKEHPYSSHMSRFAMFPSFQSPDDPETGVRATSQLFLNSLVPNSAPEVTLLSKTKGCSYRHEVIETPEKAKKKAVRWTGDHGFLDQPKALKGLQQVLYPAPPKAVMPNPKLREWDLTLSERTSNILRNLERTLWVTSYRMHYTGAGAVNPLKTDNFKEKITHPHMAQLQERSYSTFIPSKPKQGSRRNYGNNVGRNTCSPTAAELLNTSLARNQSTAAATVHQPQEITTRHNEAPHPNQMSHSSTQAQHTKVSQETSCGRLQV
ncbi:sperm-associated microtubule inner protein 4 [Pholidichthys leucotaenia]